MKEEFVTFEIAKKLKEKGFKFNNDYRLDRFFMANGINSPTISQVLKWLRNEKKIHISVDICNSHWEYRIRERIRLDESLLFISQSIPVPVCHGSSYEEAAIAGIEYVIDNLI